MFLERIATREPIPMVVDDDDGGDDCDEEEGGSGGDGEAGKTGDDELAPSIAAVGCEEEAIETVEMEDEDGYCLIDRQPPQPPSPSQAPSSPTKG